MGREGQQQPFSTTPLGKSFKCILMMPVGKIRPICRSSVNSWGQELVSAFLSLQESYTYAPDSAQARDEMLTVAVENIKPHWKVEYTN